MNAHQKTRWIVAALSLVLMTGVLQAVSRREVVPPRESFANFPKQIGEWSGRKSPDFEQRIVDVLGVDEYLNWSLQRGTDYVGLYVGYWATQRHGDTMHSPLNCLPGSGWQPVSRGILPITVGGDGGQARTIGVNRIVIEKGLNRQLVLYWYQSHNRVVANEYAGKVYTVLDAIRYNRSDAAMVRIVSNIAGNSPEAEMAAERAAVDAVRALFPVLSRFLPV
jgi:EpsI family protein